MDRLILKGIKGIGRALPGLVLFSCIIFNSQSWASGICRVVLRGTEPSPIVVTPEVERAEQFLQARSERLLNLMDDAASFGVTPVYDFVGIGGGPQMVMVVNRIRQLRPDARILVLEMSHQLGTFHAFPNFFLNTMNMVGRSSNLIFGAPVQPADLEETLPVFSSAQTVGDATVLAYEFSDVDLLTGVKAGFEFNPKNGRVTVTTRRGIQFEARNLILATGLGRPRFPLAGKSRVVFDRERARALESDRVPNLVFGDELVRHSSDTAWLEEWVDGEDLVIVGGGDGSSIAVESVLGGAPQRGRPHSNQVFRISTGRSKEPFLKKLLNFIRYGANIKFAKENGLREIRGRLVRMEESDGRYRLWVEQPDGKEVSLTAGRVVFSTGYEPDFGGPESDWELFSREGKVLGKQLVLDGTRLPVFLTGMGAGLEIGKEIPSSEVFKDALLWSYLRTHGQRGVALADHLAGPSETRTLGRGWMYEIPIPEVADSVALSPIEMKIEIGRWLRGLRFAERMSLRLFVSNDRTLVLGGPGLNVEAADFFMSSLKAFPDLLAGLRPGMEIHVKIDRQGLPQLHSIRIRSN